MAPCWYRIQEIGSEGYYIVKVERPLFLPGGCAGGSGDLPAGGAPACPASGRPDGARWRRSPRNRPWRCWRRQATCWKSARNWSGPRTVASCSSTTAAAPSSRPALPAGPPRHRQTRRLPPVPAHHGHPDAGKRRRPAPYPGHARPRRHLHHPDLNPHPPGQAGGGGRARGRGRGDLGRVDPGHPAQGPGKRADRRGKDLVAVCISWDTM